MRSVVKKHSVIIAGHKTSVSMEEEFWRAVKAIAARRDITVADLIAEVDTGRNTTGHRNANLSSAVRLHILADLQEQLSDKPPSLERAIDAIRAAGLTIQ